jgi:mannose/fructose/N-acetylgalactosamine-specific phosphotransferase system component IIC
MIEESILVTIFGGLAALDRTEAYQTMLSQPLVIGLIVGFLLRDVYTGIKIGILIQLLYLWVLPIGTAILPDPAIGGTVGTFGFIVLLRSFPNRTDSVLFFTLLYTLAFTAFAGWTLIGQRELNLKLIQKADLYAETGEISKIDKLFLWGLLGSFGRGVILTGLGISGIFILLKPIIGFLTFLPEHYLTGLEIPILGFGIATMFHFFVKRGNLLWLVLGLSLGIALVLI